ncbi:hypothetical protein M8494_26185 [Serratia ureilytica]
MPAGGAQSLGGLWGNCYTVRAASAADSFPGCYRCFFTMYYPSAEAASVGVWIDYVKQYFTDSFSDRGECVLLTVGNLLAACAPTEADGGRRQRQRRQSA